MFSNLSASSISLATVTPSLVMRGAPKLLYGAGEQLDAAQHLLAGIDGKTNVFG
jgi:hypothetical protein